MARLANILLIFAFSFPCMTAVAREKPVVKRVWGKMLKRNSFSNLRPFQLAAPVVDDKHIFVGVHRGFFYALNKKTGRHVWKASTQGAIQSTCALAGDSVFVGDTKGNLYAFKKENGKTLWVTDLRGEILSPPVVEDGRIFAVTMEQEIFALNRESGEILWQQGFPADPRQFTIRKTADPILYEGKLWIGFADGTFHSLDPETGKFLRTWNIGDRFEPFHDQDGTVAIQEGKGILSSADGRLLVLDLKTGATVWEAPVGGANRSVPVGNRLYVAAEGVLRLLNLENGQTLWEQDFDLPEISAPAFYKEWIVVAGAMGTIGTRGKVFVLNQMTGDIVFEWELWGGALSDPIIEGNRLYLLSNAAHLDAFQFRE